MMNFLGLTVRNIQSVQNGEAIRYNIIKAPSQVELVSKLAEQMPSFSFKALTSQIEAMANLDNSDPVGKKLDFAA